MRAAVQIARKSSKLQRAHIGHRNSDIMLICSMVGCFNVSAPSTAVEETCAACSTLSQDHDPFSHALPLFHTSSTAFANTCRVGYVWTGTNSECAAVRQFFANQHPTQHSEHTHVRRPRNKQNSTISPLQRRMSWHARSSLWACECASVAVGQVTSAVESGFGKR